jgi:uncharacterized protein (UPF0303 family)
MTRPVPEYTLASLEAEPVADFPSLTRDDAVRLGEIGIAVIREWDRDLAIEVRVGAELAFRAQLGTTGEQNAAAIAGKVATVTALGVSSLLARRRNEDDPSYGADLGEDARLWGGCIPIVVGGTIAGTVATSGEPDVVDHEATAETVRRYLALQRDQTAD